MEEHLPELIRRTAGGDSEAVGELLSRYGARVRASVRGRIGPALRARVDSEDILQTAMVSALANLAEFEYRGEESFVAWLVAIARQEAALLHRFHRAQKRDLAREGPPTGFSRVPGDRTTASQAALREETKARMREAILHLPDAERTVIRLRSFDGLAFEEIAVRVGLAHAEEARTLYRRTLKSLARLLVEE